MFWQKTSECGRRKGEEGRTLIEITIVASLIAVGTTLAAINIAPSQNAMRLRNSALVLTRYLEKARAAAIRCHCPATLQIVDGSNYKVSGVLSASGVNETRTVPLEPNITFGTNPMTITYNWRGRADTTVDILLSSPAETTKVNVSGGGDVSIDTPFDSTYTPPVNGVNLTNDITSDSIVSTQKFTGPNSSNGHQIKPPNHKAPKK
jgi:type II secretory pathway pseudopilin PulG